MYSFVIFLLCFLNVVNSNEINSVDCFNIKDYFWKYLGTNTPYRYVANKNDSKLQFEECQPKKIWMVIRHGTRYPGSLLINNINTRLVEIQKLVEENFKSQKDKLCESHAKNITLWKAQFDIANEKVLSHEGEDEMVELGERFLNRLPTLLDNEYSNSSFSFKSTATERSLKSKYYFTVGLFGRKVANHVWAPEPEKKDPVLRFYKLCDKWLKEVYKNPKAMAEYETFKKSKSMKKIIKNISSRLGFKEQLSYDDVELMYLTCSYESALNRAGPSPWCSIFSEEDLRTLEFARDLKDYLVDGYGHDINFQQACPLMVDMLNTIKSKDGPTSTFYFTHSGTILKFLSHLGLYYDETGLSRNNFKSPRLWKGGYMDAFGSNLAFVSFQCKDKLKLLVLHQERPVKLPGCPKDALCAFDKIMKIYKRSFYNCDFEELCKFKEENSQQ